MLRARTPQGHLLVSKDFVLTDEHGGTRVPVPSPAAGYVGRADARAGLIAIYDRAGGELIAQIRHMDLAGSGLHVGQTVAYGQPLGLQSGFGGGNPHAYGTHTHIDFNTARLDAFKQYFADIDRGEIRMGRVPPARDAAPGRHAAAAQTHATDRSPRHADVENAQCTMNHLGYTGADGRPLKIDGVVGPSSHHAIRQFQRDYHLPETGSLDAEMCARIKLEGRTMASSQHPAHALYREAVDAVGHLDRTKGILPGAHVRPLAGAVAAEAARAGLSHVHRIEMGAGGRYAQAVEFRLGVDDQATNRSAGPVDVPLALGQSLVVSSEQAAEAITRRQPASGALQRDHLQLRPAL